MKNYNDFADKFKSIGHPDRVAILELLCNCGCNRMTVKDIYNKLSLDQPSTSRHLKIMRQVGILDRVREGGDTFYCLSNQKEVDCIRKCFV